MRGIRIAFGLLILSSSTAFASCVEPEGLVLMRGTLPVGQQSPDRAKAILALPYAAMIMFVQTSQLPPGFQRGPGPADLLPLGQRFVADMSGFDPATYVSCDGRAVVIAFDGLKDYDFRDYIAGGLRMANGGYSRLALDFTAAVIAAFPQSDVSVIGHSAGGNVASFVAGAFRLPSILFSPSRGEAGLVGNDGSMQLTVIVRGDIIADHDPPLPGITLYLDKAEGRPHQIETVIDALLAVIEG